jgi:tripartite-type tricarboxylate transporter receptor subunit TctC
MRSVLTWCAALALAAILALRGADGQTSSNWPTRSIRIIVPYPPGGLSDVFARLIGDKLSRRLGQSIVIDNRPGGNTIIGTQATAQSAPDGYTLLLTNGALSINQSLVDNLPYDLDKDLAPVIWLGESYGVLVVNGKVPAKTLPELVNLAKARPGKLSVGVPGAGTNYRIAIEQLKDITGIDVTVVPYKGCDDAGRAEEHVVNSMPYSQGQRAVSQKCPGSRIGATVKNRALVLPILV